MPATPETPSPGGNPGARDHTASDEPTTTPGIAFGMGITALLAKRLPVQHRWRCHWLVPQLDATDGQGVALGRGVQPICPHYPASRYRHVQQVAPQEFLQGQGHQAHPQARSSLPVHAVAEVTPSGVQDTKRVFASRPPRRYRGGRNIPPLWFTGASCTRQISGHFTFAIVSVLRWFATTATATSMHRLWWHAVQSIAISSRCPHPKSGGRGAVSG
jgi:hypothetical protein